MEKNRLEAFSDGVIAIIITIMVLELKVPHSPNMEDLLPLLPKFGSYVLSFTMIGIYWNNHHHLLQASECVNGKILWANLHLLFWLSLIPFVTDWMGENHFSAAPTSLYGVVLFCAGAAYYLLARALVQQHGKKSAIARAIGKDFKGKVSVLIYAIAIPTAFYIPYLSIAFYVFVELMWLFPDRRIEKAMGVDAC